jgi:hypothetical protein
MIQEERPVFLEVIVLVIVGGKKEVHINRCLILDGFRDGAG